MKLGSKTKIPDAPSYRDLECVPNKGGDLFAARFTCPEFTSLCPVTGQPDFGTIIIDYVPDTFLIESKSLKLYLFSYRNHQAFHEECTNNIMRDLHFACSPRLLRVTAVFNPRGGIPIDVQVLSDSNSFHMNMLLPVDPSLYRPRF